MASLIFGRKMAGNLSKTLFDTLRIFVNYNPGERWLSNSVSKGTNQGQTDDMVEKSSTEEKQGVETDPFAPFPDNVNPVTGEINGPKGPEPTRYGDWERKGRCIDF